jgi:SAM-dependent methyltransferase
VYERARPEYPLEAVLALRDRLELVPGDPVLELAAGTGKLTRALVGGLGARVIAVEPSDAMRGEFVHAVPGVPILDGTAEQIPLGDSSVKAVVVGQAFHWFRAEEAVHEIARVLRADGGVALIWNMRDERVPWVQRFGEILRPPERESAPSSRDRDWQTAFEDGSGFLPLRREEFQTVQRLSVDGLVERAMSVSYVARLAEPERIRVAASVRGLVDADEELSGRPQIDLPYVTELYWSRRAPAGAGANHSGSA